MVRWRKWIDVYWIAKNRVKIKLTIMRTRKEADIKAVQVRILS
jgi:hypothetical protein